MPSKKRWFIYFNNRQEYLKQETWQTELFVMPKTDQGLISGIHKGILIIKQNFISRVQRTWAGALESGWAHFTLYFSVNVTVTVILCKPLSSC